MKGRGLGGFGVVEGLSCKREGGEEISLVTMSRSAFSKKGRGRMAHPAAGSDMIPQLAKLSRDAAE